MKDLYESILGGTRKIIKSQSAKDIIKEWILENYKVSKTKIKVSKTPDEDGLYIVNIMGRNADITIKNHSITSLTNGLFKFGVVEGCFICESCPNLKSLEGGPKKVDVNFSCEHCDSLKSLEGAPEEVGRGFFCGVCGGLTTLEGAPKKIWWKFYCGSCGNLTSLKGAPEEVEIFDCSCCRKLKSLEGGPKKVDDFRCDSCDGLTTLKGAPVEISGDLRCDFCKNLISLEGLPKTIGGNLICYDLPSLKDPNEMDKINVGGKAVKYN